MTSVEQHKIIKELQEVEHRMTGEELEEFRMYRKRDYDDEDLDTHSRKRIKELHEKYTGTRRGKKKDNPLDKLFG